MKTDELVVTLPSDREIKLERSFDAPRTLVWKACTTPEIVRRWWGPRGYVMTVCEIDLRPGGAWRYVHRAPDGTEHPFTGVYKEIVAPERLVQTWIYDVPPINEHPSIETMTLTEHDGRTTLTTLVLHDSKESRDAHANAMQPGAGESFDRLAETLATLS